MGIKLMGGGEIREITENKTETEFEQSDAIINYGSGPISTYNLVNCIAIGGVFTLPDGSVGTFLTHESPTEYYEQEKKLNTINGILKSKGGHVSRVNLFHIDEPSKNRYNGGMTTQKVISHMKEYAQTLFGIEPILKEYTCDTKSFRCGKALITPTSYNTSVIPFRIPKPNIGYSSYKRRQTSRNFGSSSAASSSSATSSSSAAYASSPKFEPEYLPNYNIRCPECGVVQDGAISSFEHKEGCKYFGQDANYVFSKSLAALKGGRRTTKRRKSRRSTRRRR